VVYNALGQKKVGSSVFFRGWKEQWRREPIHPNLAGATLSSRAENNLPDSKDEGDGSTVSHFTTSVKVRQAQIKNTCRH
jgi:hypothetical protein